MERVLKGRTKEEEKIFTFLDDLRRKGVKDPAKAIEALKEEFGIEPRLGVLWMRRHISCFR